MNEQLDLIYLPELSMSFPSLKNHLSKLYNIKIQKNMKTPLQNRISTMASRISNFAILSEKMDDEYQNYTYKAVFDYTSEDGTTEKIDVDIYKFSNAMLNDDDPEFDVDFSFNKSFQDKFTKEEFQAFEYALDSELADYERQYEYAKGGGVGDKDEYELEVSVAPEDVWPDKWQIKYRKKRLFSSWKPLPRFIAVDTEDFLGESFVCESAKHFFEESIFSDKARADMNKALKRYYSGLNPWRYRENDVDISELKQMYDKRKGQADINAVLKDYVLQKTGYSEDVDEAKVRAIYAERKFRAKSKEVMKDYFFKLNKKYKKFTEEDIYDGDKKIEISWYPIYIDDWNEFLPDDHLLDIQSQSDSKKLYLLTETYYKTKQAAETVATILSENNDAILKKVIKQAEEREKQKAEEREKQKAEREKQKAEREKQKAEREKQKAEEREETNYMKPSYFADGGGVKERFFVGQSIMFPLTNNPKLDSSVRNWHNKYANKELVIEKIKADKPYNLADVFVRSTGEKIEDIILNPRYIQQYAKGGGVGSYSVIDNKSGMVVKGGFATENEAKKYMYDLFERNPENSFYYSVRMEQYADGGGVGDYAENKFDSSVAKLREYIRKYPYIWTKNDKEYVPIEGWQFAGLILGYSTRVTEVMRTANGYMAKAEVIDGNGNVVCSGFGLVDKSESKWSGKPEYQLVGFAQTRAVSRALRNCLSWMVKAAGFSTTPAEEMYGVAPEKRRGGMKSRPFMPPAAPQEPDFIFDEPKYKAPIAPPTPPAPVMPEDMGGFDAQKIEDTLREMNAKAKANNIVIISPEFMDRIKNALLETNTDLHMSMLKQAIDYMDQNNIILQTPRYMSKLRKIAGQKPF